jgi:hypothetical protein
MKRYKLTLNSLTPEQYKYFKENIYNGVGSDEFPINPHDLIFKRPAEFHDFCYWRGGTKEDLKIADNRFLKLCLKRVKKEKKYTRPFYYCVAYVYYYFLVALGK